MIQRQMDYLYEKNSFPLTADMFILLGFRTVHVPLGWVRHQCLLQRRPMKQLWIYYRYSLARIFPSLFQGPKSLPSSSPVAVQNPHLVPEDLQGSHSDSTSTNLQIRISNFIRKYRKKCIL